MSKVETAALYIDSNPDLYYSLRTAHTVVSEVSTGLFEAVGIVDRIFIWDTQKSRFGYPMHPFEKFDSVETLIEKLTDKAYGIHNESLKSEDIWSENWKSNYENFLTKHVLV